MVEWMKTRVSNPIGLVKYREMTLHIQDAFQKIKMVRLEGRTIFSGRRDVSDSSDALAQIFEPATNLCFGLLALELGGQLDALGRGAVRPFEQ